MKVAVKDANVFIDLESMVLYLVGSLAGRERSHWRSCWPCWMGLISTVADERCCKITTNPRHFLVFGT